MYRAMSYSNLSPNCPTNSVALVSTSETHTRFLSPPASRSELHLQPTPQVPPDSPLAQAYSVGTIDPRRIIKIVTTYLKVYWDWVLLEKKENGLLMHETPMFPEVIFEDL